MKKNINMKKIAIGFISVGFLLFVLFVGMESYTKYKYNQLINKFQSTITQGSDGNLNGQVPLDSIDTLADNVLALIKIDKINVKHPILEGVGDNVLKVAVGHFPETKMPGQMGNFALIGHRNYTFSQPFKDLDKLEVGDEIVIETRNSSFTYKVTNKKIVSPSQTDVLDSRGGSTITVVTCTDHASKRLVIEGNLIKK